MKISLRSIRSISTLILSTARSNGELRTDVPFLFNAAKKLGSTQNELVIFKASQGVDYKAQVATFASPKKIHALPSFKEFDVDNATETVTGLMANSFTHVIASHTFFYRNLIPRIAGKLDIQPITDITAIHSHDEFERQIYSGHAVATVKSTEPVKLLTVRSNRFSEGEKTACGSLDSIITEILKAGSGDGTMRSRGLVPCDDSFDVINRAKVVLCGGHGTKDKKTFNLLKDVAKLLPNAAVAGSRGALDDGYIIYDQLIGQSGKCLNSDVYVGIGVSGALQHLAGVVDVKTIIAINTDPEANLVKVADYYFIGDSQKVIPEMISRLKAKK